MGKLLNTIGTIAVAGTLLSAGKHEGNEIFPEKKTNECVQITHTDTNSVATDTCNKISVVITDKNRDGIPERVTCTFQDDSTGTNETVEYSKYYGTTEPAAVEIIGKKLWIDGSNNKKELQEFVDIINENGWSGEFFDLEKLRTKLAESRDKYIEEKIREERKQKKK